MEDDLFQYSICFVLVVIVFIFCGNIIYKIKNSLPYQQINIEFENINDIENNKYIKVNNEFYYKEVEK